MTSNNNTQANILKDLIKQDNFDFNKAIEAMTQKFIGILSISKKAGKIIYGFDSVQKASLYGEIEVIYLACDLSEKTKSNIIFFCSQNNSEVICTDFTMDEFHFMMGRKTGIISISDKGLCLKAKDYYNDLINLKTLQSSSN
ncbi:MAG: hypothetical protein RR549_06900 [Oscillospiraceae bacterium]